MKKNIKLTDKHFEIFKTEARFWINKFHLNNWKVYFNFEKLDVDAFALCSSDMLGKVATLSLNIDHSSLGLEDLITAVKAHAKHEVLHLLISRVTSCGKYRFVSQDMYEEAGEELVRKLENIIQ
jgi:hypothetical protein